MIGHFQRNEGSVNPLEAKSSEIKHSVIMWNVEDS